MILALHPAIIAIEVVAAILMIGLGIYSYRSNQRAKEERKAQRARRKRRDDD